MGLGLTGIKGIGGLGGSSLGYPSSRNVGGLGYSSQSSSQPLSGGGAGQVRQSQLQQQQSPGALSQLSSGVGMANMANKAYEGLAGETTGLGGGLGMASSALGAAGSLDRVASGKGTPSDYLNLAKTGYNLYNAGSLGSAATNGSAYSSLASAAEGAEDVGSITGALTGASAGLGYFTGGAGALLAAMSAEEARNAKAQANLISHGHDIASELHDKGFNPNSIDFSQAYLNPSNFDYTQREVMGDIANGAPVNNTYFQNLFGGYDPTAIANFLRYGLSPDLIAKSQAARTAATQAIKSDPRFPNQNPLAYRRG